MLKQWDYTQANRSRKEKAQNAAAAADRLVAFSTSDPDMPFYCRDPRTMRNDPRYRQLKTDEQDKFGRMIDEMWIGKGCLHNDPNVVAEALGVTPDEAERLTALYLQLGLISRHGFRIYIPELREQYVRAVMKSEIRNTSKERHAQRALAGNEQAAGAAGRSLP